METQITKNKKKIPEMKINGKKIPDPRQHQIISIVKSVIRILACIVGIAVNIEAAFVGLILAEGVGILEELV